jgi:multidrug transporter EmrE-like cation transporter
MTDYEDDIIEFIIVIIVAGIAGVVAASALNNGTDLGSTYSDLIGVGLFVVVFLGYYGLIRVHIRVDR